MLSKSPIIAISRARLFGKRTDLAKEVPILNIFPLKEKVYESAGKIMLKCPLHKDDTASFCIYTKTNSWNCFGGCGGGDVITFLMRLYDIDFQEAVNRLVK